jgi:hypothetical protein
MSVSPPSFTLSLEGRGGPRWKMYQAGSNDELR